MDHNRQGATQVGKELNFIFDLECVTKFDRILNVYCEFIHVCTRCLLELSVWSNELLATMTIYNVPLKTETDVSSTKWCQTSLFHRPLTKLSSYSDVCPNFLMTQPSSHSISSNKFSHFTTLISICVAALLSVSISTGSQLVAMSWTLFPVMLRLALLLAWLRKVGESKDGKRWIHRVTVSL